MHHPVSPQIKKFFGNTRFGFFIRRSMPGGRIFYTAFVAVYRAYFYIFTEFTCTGCEKAIRYSKIMIRRRAERQ